MSADIESLTVESAARRTGGGGNPTAVALAAIALLLAAAAHWRVNRASDRIDGVSADLTELSALQQRSSERVHALATQLETSSAALRDELAGLRVIPAQLAELGTAVEELSARTAAPQRGWARSEALYLLELAQRRVDLERDVRTAIIAMESADARLSTLGDPALGEVRRLLAAELSALRAVPAPDLPHLLARLTSVGDLEHSFPLCIFRRTRADVSVSGTRRTRWLRVRPTDVESQMHRALTAYVRRVWRNPASAAARLAMIVLTRRACSCASSLARTLERRLTLLDTFAAADGQLDLPLHLFAENDDEPDAEVGAPGLADRAAERRTIEAILELARQATSSESKMRCLARLLRRSNEPAIVFTEFRDTLGPLQRRLAGVETCVLHGGLTAAERSAVIREFTGGGRRVLLATDAASEGLNLQQRCRMVIHLEVPWTPTRIEQRVGRVDRIGQSRIVHQLHLVGRDTIEETRVVRLAQRRSHIASAFDGLSRPSSSDSESAAYIIGGSPLPPPDSSSVLPGVTSDRLRDRASAEAARLVTARRLLPPDAVDRPTQVRPFVTCARRGAGALGWWALWIELADWEGHLLWETLIGVSGNPGWTRQRSRKEIRRLIDGSWKQIREVAGQHRGLAQVVAESLRASMGLVAQREHAIAREIAQRHARMAATLLQPGLFDRRAERQAGAQRETIDHALALCHERLAALQRQRRCATALRPAFSLIAW